MSNTKNGVCYGCHVDLQPGEEADGCVIDESVRSDCVYASRVVSKWDCKYWRPTEASAAAMIQEAERSALDAVGSWFVDPRQHGPLTEAYLNLLAKRIERDGGGS